MKTKNILLVVGLVLMVGAIFPFNELPGQNNSKEVMFILFTPSEGITLKALDDLLPENYYFADLEWNSGAKADIDSQTKTLTVNMIVKHKTIDLKFLVTKNQEAGEPYIIRAENLNKKRTIGLMNDQVKINKILKNNKAISFSKKDKIIFVNFENDEDLVRVYYAENSNETPGPSPTTISLTN